MSENKNQENQFLTMKLSHKGQQKTMHLSIRHAVTFCAAAVIVATPITLLFMWLQKYYVEGVTGGAVKG